VLNGYVIPTSREEPVPQDRPRVLFVDDEPSIRLTLPPVLQEAGFEVRVSESVPDALFEINTNPFDVLISDLNIGEEGDGFLVVSAMRHIQPDCTNFILTGYPAFETALQAIHNQVDDYLVKPVEVGSLIKAVRARVESRGGKRVGMKLAGLLKQTEKLSESTRTAIKKTGDSADEDLIALLTGIVEKLELGREEPSQNASRAASEYGKRMKDQGASLLALLNSFECLNDSVYALLQSSLTTTDMTNIVSDLRRFHHSMNRLLEKSIEGYSKRKAS
jgi:ActR/RegA family two-component response regulator